MNDNPIVPFPIAGDSFMQDAYDERDAKAAPSEAPEHLDLVDKELWYLAGMRDELKQLNRWMFDLNNNLQQINENGRWMAEWFKGLSDEVQAELARRGATQRPTPRERFTLWRKP